MPVKNAVGTNTAESTSAIDTSAAPTSSMVLRAASRGVMPCSRFRSIFSTTTMASSTTMPIASTSPNNDRLFSEKPNAYIAAKVPIRDTGDGDDGNDRRAPALQEQDNDEDDQQHRLEQGVINRRDRLLHKFGRVVDDFIIQAPRKVPRQAGHGGLDLVDCLDRVAARALVRHDGNGGFAIEIAVGKVILRAQLDAGHVADSGKAPAAPAFYDHLLELLHAGEAALRVGGHLKGVIGNHRLLPKRPGGNLHVLLAQGGYDVAGGQIQRRETLGIQPHAHAVLARAEHDDFAHSLDTRQHVLNLLYGIVAHVELIEGIIRRPQMHHYHEIGRAFDGGD